LRFRFSLSFVFPVHKYVVNFLIFFFELILKSFDYVSHFLLIASFLTLKLSDQSVDFVIFLFFQHIELHLIAFALDLQVEIFVLFQSH